MSRTQFLCLGVGDGWHSQQLQKACEANDATLVGAAYESLGAQIESGRTVLSCEAGPLDRFDAILTRTMPMGSLETITFRLSILHHLHAQRARPAIVNPPRSLEMAIDKFATLARVRDLGYSVPETIAVQSRAEAMAAWSALGGDCIVKPLFGGEGRGVMRITERELAWTAFSTLEQIQSVMYVQRFVPPGGRDTRLLVIGGEVLGIYRQNDRDFRANVAGGGRSEAIELDQALVDMAHRISDSIGLTFAAVDLIHTSDGSPMVIEVNGIPGWKGAQATTQDSIAERIVRHLHACVRNRAAALKQDHVNHDGNQKTHAAEAASQ
ncbi:MAG: RimK family alpha-L-glutamate ligase [Planctomycetota bacterium]